jgi:hypothetical protein
MRVFRPLADVFPLIEVEEFDPLVASINASNGRPHKNSPPAPTPGRQARPANRHDLHRDAVWRGNRLFFRRKLVATIIQDEKYPSMWRVRLPNGHVSDMVNLTRAKDAAMALACKEAAA